MAFVEQEFLGLMMPFLNENVFPTLLLKELFRHMKNPKATYNADVRLSQVFMGYDARDAGEKIFLADIPDNFCFKFRSKIYRKLTTNRTRVLCQEYKTDVKYTIPVLVEVEPVDLM